MPTVTRLAQYRDDQGNEIVYAGVIEQGVRIKFTGQNKRLVVADTARLRQLTVDFNCDNGVLEIGSSTGVPAFAAAIRSGRTPPSASARTSRQPGPWRCPRTGT